ncbi:MAG: hypothetical protein IT293_18235 [Deltaproteobacteria bacterium]|nr:hypothetical protein [Deltaproteobacteria bacterium]
MRVAVRQGQLVLERIAARRLLGGWCGGDGETLFDRRQIRERDLASRAPRGDDLPCVGDQAAGTLQIARLAVEMRERGEEPARWRRDRREMLERRDPVSRLLRFLRRLRIEAGDQSIVRRERDRARRLLDR